MIQRIQTVYLLLALLLLGFLFLIPYASFSGSYGAASYTLLGGETNRADGLTIIDKPHLLLLILVGINIVGLLVAIFLFKNRKAQLALVYTSIFSMVSTLGILLFATYSQINVFKSSEISLHINIIKSVGFLIPVISIVLAGLAAKGIKKDEELIRSADRIR